MAICVGLTKADFRLALAAPNLLVDDLAWLAAELGGLYSETTHGKYSYGELNTPGHCIYGKTGPTQEVRRSVADEILRRLP